MKIKSFRQTWTGQTKIHLHFLSSCRSQKSRSFSRVRNTRIKGCNVLLPSWSNSLHIILRPRLHLWAQCLLLLPISISPEHGGNMGMGMIGYQVLSSPGPSPSPSPCPNIPPSRIKVTQKREKKGFGPWADTIFTWVVTHPPPP